MNETIKGIILQSTYSIRTSDATVVLDDSYESECYFSFMDEMTHEFLLLNIPL